MTQVPAELIEFEERLDNYEEIYISRVKDNTKKKPISLLKSTNPPSPKFILPSSTGM